MSRFAPPPGTADITPSEVTGWNFLESEARRIFGLYGFGEIRTPVFEYTEVFERGIGDQTEVVQKEMYTFQDRGGRSLTLRPEGTAGVMRSLAGTDVLNGTEQRVFYVGPMFRGERPAAGRRRQFHQIGAENAGRKHPRLDAECIAMLVQYLQTLGIHDAKVLINTRGEQADRQIGSELLRTYFAPHIESMCPDCKQRFQKNIWRILDCKCAECRPFIEDAPDVTQAFTPESKAYFAEVCAALDALNIVYTVDPRLVRGLDYYVHTVFEITHHGLGAQSAVAGGGRYEIMLNGSNKPIIGVGFAAGMERLLMVREALGVDSVPSSVPSPVWFTALGAEAEAFCWKMSDALRACGIAAAMEAESGKSMKSQMRSANRVNASYMVICGENELHEGVVTLKNMISGEQLPVKVAELVETVQSVLKKDFQTHN